MCTVHVTVSLSTMCRSVHVCSTWAPSLCIHRPKAAASRPPAPAQVWMRVQLAGIDGGGDEGVGTRRSKLWEWHTPCTRGYAANPISSLGREGASTGERYLFRNNFTPNGTGGTTPFEVGAGASIFSFQFAVGPCGQEGAGAAEAKGGGGGWGHVAWHVSGLCCPVSSESGGDVGDFVAEVRGVGGNSAEEAGEHGLPPGWTRFIEPAGEVYMHVTGKKTNSRPAWGDEGVHRGGKHGQAQGGGRGPCFRIAFDQSSSAGGGAVGMALRVKWFECEMDVR